MEALQQYLKEMPQLSDLVLECLGDALANNGIDYNNADEMRLAYKEAQQVAMEKVEDAGRPYYVVSFPQISYKCPHCNEEVRGGFYEISNPKTRVRGQFRVRLMHEILAHANAGYFEPLVNMSDTIMGTDDHGLDVKKLMKILNGLDVPPDVVANLQAIQAEAGK